MTTNTNIEAGLRTYVAALNALMRAHRGDDTISVTHEVRRKYAKIIVTSWGSRSSYSYVNLTTGDVVKGNWKGVEKAVEHIVRGNVLDGSWLAWHGPYGIGYKDAHGEFARMLSADELSVARDMILAGDAERAATVLACAVAERRGAA